jgi:D-galactonate transporter
MTDIQKNSSEDAIYRKVSLRLMPLLFLAYIVAYLDRVNVGFAKLQMISALNLTDAIYGLGAGIFFFGYFIFEVPSNIFLHRVGARKWIFRIMISWGVLSGCMMFVNSETSFYVMRFLLGVAEAGFFPGIILYLTYWFPAERRGRATSMFLAAIAFAGIIGGPVSGWIMKSLDGTSGLQGWQWLFLIEALPSLVMAFVILFFLDDRVADAKWLSDEERAIIATNIERDSAHKEEYSILKSLTSIRVWHMALIYLSFVAGLYGISFWLPTIIKAFGVTDTLDVGLLSSIPWTFGVIAMYFAAKSADLRNERRWHAIWAGIAGAVGFSLSVVLKDNTVLSMAALTLGTMGVMTSLPLFWALPTSFLTGTAAAAGIALINSIGNLSGFGAPFVMGLIKEATKSTDSGVYLLAGMMLLGAFLVYLVPKPNQK